MLIVIAAAVVVVALSALVIAGLYARGRLPAVKAQQHHLDRAYKAAQALVDDPSTPSSVAAAAVTFYRHAQGCWLSLLVLTSLKCGGRRTDPVMAAELRSLHPDAFKLVVQCLAASTCASAMTMPILGRLVLRQIASHEWAKNPAKASPEAAKVALVVARRYRHHDLPAAA